MNILFLDIDGVLNSKQLFLMRKGCEISSNKAEFEEDIEYMKAYTDPNNMWCLKYILDNVPDLSVVLSTSWRNLFDMEAFRELFQHYGLDANRIIGKTPQRLSSERVHEIHMYLDDNKDITKWAVLDDHVIFNLEDVDKANEFLTDSWIGLMMIDAFKIIRHFNLEFKEPVMMV